MDLETMTGALALAVVSCATADSGVAMRGVVETQGWRAIATTRDEIPDAGGALF